jgi:cardiolipin synthase
MRYDNPRQVLIRRRLAWVALAACASLAAGCGTLPRLDLDPDASHGRPPSFANANRVLTDTQSKAIVDKLKRQAGDTDILTRHIAVSEAISGGPMITGNQVILLQDGPATYAAMFAAIRGATKNINFATYIFEPDETGKQFAELLIEKRRQGVEVNLIYDSVGCLATPREFFDGLKSTGIRVVEFNPVNPLKAERGWQLNKRSHRKLLIVDGSTAFVGGINISNVYSSGSSGSVGSHASGSARSSGSWRDTHLQISGPVVAEFQKLFLQSWDKQKGESLAGSSYLPALTTKGAHIVRAIGSTPEDQRNEQYLTLLAAVTFAERNVYLTNGYFAPDPQFLEALRAAAGRGVDVKLILSSISDFPLVFYAGRSHYSDLLAAGVRIYERSGPLLHAKTSTVDGVWSTVGTTNLDWRSFLHNEEVDAAILGRDFALQMEAMFARDLVSSQEITAEQWQRRSPGERLKEFGARMFEYLL